MTQKLPGGGTIVLIEEPRIRGFLHTPTSSTGDGLVLTHGAGANCQSPLLRALADEFSKDGFTVLRYDLPFRQLRPHGPPIRTADKDQEGIAQAIEFMKQRVPGRIFAGGHSYGGRMTTMLAASQPSVCDGLLLLSYPLHPPKAPTQLRTSHFSKLQTPALFVSGIRDGFGSIDEMTAALQLIPARTKLLPVEAAGHELLSKRNAEALPRCVVEAFQSFFSPK